MKEYRIKATSAEHRKSIIGAMAGLGVHPHGHFENFPFEDGWVVVGIGSDDELFGSKNTDRFTHTSLDTLIADIIRDRQTVEIEIDNEVHASIGQHSITLKVRSEVVVLTQGVIDRIFEAVKKVRP